MNELSAMQKLWKEVQADRNEVSQRDRLGNDLYPLFVSHCSTQDSPFYRQTFGDGSALVSVLSRSICRSTRDALRLGCPEYLEPALTLMRSPVHGALVAMLGILIDVEFYSPGVGLALHDEVIRIVVLHNIPSMLVALCKAYFDLCEFGCEDQVIGDDAILCVVKKQFTILHQMSPIPRVLDELKASNSVGYFFGAFARCIKRPSNISPSLTGITLETCSVMLKTHRAILQNNVAELKQTLADACQEVQITQWDHARAQSIHHLLQCQTTFFSAFPPTVEDSVSDFGASQIVTAILSVENCIEQHPKLLDGISDSFLALALTPLAAVKEAKRSKGFSFASFTEKLVQAPSQISKFVQGTSGQEANQQQKELKKPITLPSFVEAYLSWMICARPWIQLSLSNTFVSFAQKSSIEMTDGLRFRLFSALTENYMMLHDNAQRSVNRWLEAIIHHFEPTLLRPIVEKLIFHTNSCNECWKTANVLTLLTAVGAREENAELVLSVNCHTLVLTCASRAVPAATGAPQFTFYLERLGILMKVLWRIPNFVGQCDEEKLYLCFRDMLTCDPSVGAMSRDILSAFLAASGSISALLRNIIEDTKQGEQWNSRVTQLLLTLLCFLCRPQAAEEVVKKNGIEIMLSLFQFLEFSSSLHLDSQAICCVLSALLPLVRFSEVGKMISVSLSKKAETSHCLTQCLIDLVCGTYSTTESIQHFIDEVDRNMFLTEDEIALFSMPAEDRFFFFLPEPFQLLLQIAMKTENTSLAKVCFRILEHRAGSLEDEAYLKFISTFHFLPLVPSVANPGRWGVFFSSMDDSLCYWEAALLSEVRPCTRGIEFRGSGGARGTTAVSSWPPGSGYSLGVWCCWTTVTSDSSRLLAPIIGVSWAQGTSIHSVSLLVDAAAGVTVFKTTAGSQETTYALPLLPRDQWTYLLVSHQKSRLGQSEATFYVNGVTIKKCSVGYPGSSMEQAKAIDVAVGFQEGERSPGVVIRVNSVQIYETALSQAMVGSLFSASLSDPQMAEWGAPVSHLLDSPVLQAVDLKFLSTLRNGEVLTELGELPQDLVPRQKLIVSLHSNCFTFVDSTFQYLDNKLCVLLNLADAGAHFHLHGNHSVPSTKSDPTCSLIAEGGLTQLLEWLEDSALMGMGTLEEVALTLRLLEKMLFEANTVITTRREIAYKLAGIILRAPASFSSEICVHTLLSLAFGMAPGRGYVVINLFMVDGVVLNWRYLSQLSTASGIHVLHFVRDKVLGGANPLARLNAERLLRIDFHGTFLAGLIANYVSPEVALLGIEVLELYLAGVNFHRRVLGDIFLFLCATVTPGKQDYFPATQYVALIRNLLLRSLCLLSRSAYASTLLEQAVLACPPWWILTMCSSDSDPVSVALSLQLIFFLGDRQAFRATLERQGVFLALQPLLSQYCLCDDVLSLLLNAALERTKHCLQRTTNLLEDGFARDTNCDPHLLSTFLSLVKVLSTSLQKGVTRPCKPAQSVFAYFDQSLARRKFKKGGRLFRIVALTVFSILLWKKPQSKNRNTQALASPSQEDISRGETTLCNCVNAVTLLTLSLESFFSAITAGNAFRFTDYMAWVFLANFPELAGGGASSPKAVRGSTAELDANEASPTSTLTQNDDDDEDTWKTPTTALPPAAHQETQAAIADLCQAIDTPLYASTAEFYGALAELSLSIVATPTTANAYSVVKAPWCTQFLHHLLQGVPQGVGEQATNWFQCQLIHFWVTSIIKLVRRSPLSGDLGVTIVKNITAVSWYLVERIVSGLPTQVAEVGKLLTAAIPIVEAFSAAEGKALRLAFSDWVLYVVSPAFHQNRGSGFDETREVLYSVGLPLLKAPLLSDHHNWIFSRLVEMLLSKLTDYDSTFQSDCVRLGVLIQTMFIAGQSQMVSILVDNGGSNRPRINLLHGGFDCLLQPIDPVPMFLNWALDNKYQLFEWLKRLTPKDPIQFHSCFGKRHRKWSVKEQEVHLKEIIRVNTRRDEASSVLSGFWNKIISTTGLTDPSLLHYKHAVRLEHVVSENTEIECAMTTPTVWSTAFDSSVGTPTAAYITRDFLSLATEDVGNFSCNVNLTPSAVKLLRRFLAPANELLWIGNIYFIQGTETIISTLLLTKDDVIVISSSQVTESGDFLIAALRPHDASSCQMKQKDVITDALRRFLPRAPAAVLGPSSLANFRHSQYFRQLRTQRQGNNSYVWKFPLQLFKVAHERRFQHQSAGLELDITSSASIFFVILSTDLTMSKSERSKLLDKLTTNAPWISIENSNSKKTYVQSLQKKWQKKQVSTLRYIQAVNDAASRSTAELSQYPVFPWVFADYGAPTIDLSSQAHFRDLTKPMGALSSTRAAEVVERYKEWVDDHVPRFHYGTHYSSSAIVMYYLVRIQPYTRLSRQYQGGKLDVADRLFHSIDDAWKSSSSASGRDVKELIPELFALGKPLLNTNNVDLGTRRDGIRLGDVVLPPWSERDVDRFIAVHRSGLESEAVGQNIHNWIDLVFGYKQRGEEAVAAINVFHHLTYEEGLERAISDATTEEDRQAIVAQVDNFGVTPKQIFKNPHPKRGFSNTSSLQSIWFAVASQPMQRKQVSYMFPKQYVSTQRIVLLQDDGSTILCSTRTCQFLSTKPSQYVELRPASGSLACFLSKDHSISSIIPSLSPYGAGRLYFTTASEDGMTLCVSGTASSMIFVFRRRSLNRPFQLYHFLKRPTAHKVSFLKLVGPYLIACYDAATTVEVWAIGPTFCNFMCSAPLNEIEVATSPVRLDRQDVKGASVDTEELLLYVAKERHVWIISLGSGAVVAVLSLSTVSEPLSPITAVSAVSFPSYSPANVVLLGHADGTLSIWQSEVNLAEGNLGLRSLKCASRQLPERRAAVTSLLPQPSIMSVVIAFDDSTLIQLTPQVSIDQLLE